MAAFQWGEKQKIAALSLADGKTQQEVATDADISPRTIRRWLTIDEFSAEVDRLTLMTGIAARADRLKIAKRVVRERMRDGSVIETEKDILDWLKYAQSETDGVRLDLAALSEAMGGVDLP